MDINTAIFLQIFALILLLVSLLVVLATVIFKIRQVLTLKKPVDISPEKGSAIKGIIYAFTMGMLPWSKESTRRHILEYVRGIVFHLGIFTGLAFLFPSIWIDILSATVQIPLAVILGAGSIAGVAGITKRFLKPYPRALSNLDDFISPILVTLFLLTALIFVLNPVTINPIYKVVFYITSSVMFFYSPFSKLYHCLYFFFSRTYFGTLLGRRGILNTETVLLKGKSNG